MPLPFALLGHPASLEHVTGLLPRLRPDLAAGALLPAGALLRALEGAPPFATEPELILPGGPAPLRGRLIVCTFLPEQTASPRQLSLANQKTRAGLRLAQSLGAQIVGLGGFTSIVVGTQAERLPAEFGLAVTSGNALTAALALEQIRSALNRFNGSLSGVTVAVLGATGDIGRACTQALVAWLGANRILLIARNRVKLESLRAELREAHTGLDLQVSTEPAEAARAGLIVAATSAAGPLLSESDLQPGAIVCDIGYPNTLRYSREPRPDVLAFQGGLAQAPFELPLSEFTGLPAPTLLHGCFAETIVLALAGRYESYSLVPGALTLAGLQASLALARAHGFSPAPLLRNNCPISPEAMESFVRFAAAGKTNP